MLVQVDDSAPVSGRGSVDLLIEEVGQWPGVEIGEHRFGGTAFHLGRRELGHLHERTAAAGASRTSPSRAGCATS